MDKDLHFIKPVDGARVTDPVTGKSLPPEGKAVDYNATTRWSGSRAAKWWIRKLGERDRSTGKPVAVELPMPSPMGESKPSRSSRRAARESVMTNISETPTVTADASEGID